MDAKLFRQIYYPFHEKLYRIAFRILQDMQNAEDSVQETYLKLWDKRHELGHVEHPEKYAVMTLRNMCLNHIRAQKGKITQSHDFEIPEEHSLLSQIEDRDEIAYLKQLITKLPEQQRQVIMLRHVEGYSYEEIGDIIEQDVKSVRVVVSRARKALREHFEKIEKQ